MVIQAYKYLEQRNVDNTAHMAMNIQKLMEQRKRPVAHTIQHTSPKKQKISPLPTNRLIAPLIPNAIPEKPNETKDDGNDVMVIQADNGSVDENEENKEEPIEEINFYTGEQEQADIKIESVGFDGELIQNETEIPSSSSTAVEVCSLLSQIHSFGDERLRNEIYTLLCSL